jgi:hypothetical protein
MKHIKKYNEVFEPDIDFEYIDSEYIKNCFIDFIDKGAIFEFNVDDDDPRLDQVDIFIQDVDNPNSNSSKNASISYIKSKRIFSDIIKNNITNAKLILDYWLDIENCVEKVKLKYPKLNFDIIPLTYSIKITITK